MKLVGPPDTWQTARSLLRAERSRSALHPTASFLVPVVVALGNLLFCAFLEQPIKDDPTGRQLSLFVFAQGLLILFVTLAHLTTSGRELLHKSLVMPIAAPARLAFAMMTSALNPVFLALVASNVLFFLVIYHESAGAILLVPLFVLVMAANLAALTSVATVAGIRRGQHPAAFAACCLLGAAGMILVSLYLHIPGILGLVPPMSLTAEGITVIAAGRTGLSVLYGIASLGFLLATAFVGRRIA